MSILCSICQDKITERPQTHTQGDDDEGACALCCGHLFHVACIQMWFRTSTERARRDGGAVPRRGHGSCPCCKTICSIAKALRVFPTEREDVASEALQQKQTLDALKAETDILRDNNDWINQLLSQASNELKHETLAHDMLKIQYAQALSRLQVLQEEDASGMKASMDSTLRAEMEKLEKEKKSALRKVGEMAAKTRRLQAELELLSTGNKEFIDDVHEYRRRNNIKL